MAYKKVRLIDEWENMTNCPVCDDETLWKKYGYGICSNEKCEFVGEIKECKNGCGNVLEINDSNLYCIDCAYVVVDKSH